MIRWLFRLFPLFRCLEIDLAAAREACQAEAVGRERAESRLDDLIKDRDRDREMLQQALEGERYALHTQVNILSQRSGAGVPYADAHRIESPVLSQEGGPVGPASRMLPSQRAEARRQAAIEEIVNNNIAPMFVKRT